LYVFLLAQWIYNYHMHTISPLYCNIIKKKWFQQILRNKESACMFVVIVFIAQQKILTIFLCSWNEMWVIIIWLSCCFVEFLYCIFIHWITSYYLYFFYFSYTKSYNISIEKLFIIVDIVTHDMSNCYDNKTRATCLRQSLWKTMNIIIAYSERLYR
jgi:hypothetical protein